MDQFFVSQQELTRCRTRIETEFFYLVEISSQFYSEHAVVFYWTLSVFLFSTTIFGIHYFFRKPENVSKVSNDSKVSSDSNDLKNPNGLLAIGGDLGETRLLSAYQKGIFPWYNEGEPILWWAPNPRCILKPKKSIFPIASKNVSEKTNFRLHIIKILQMLSTNVQLTEIKITIHG